MVTRSAALANTEPLFYHRGDNLALNGAVDVSQELGVANTTIVSGTPKYTADLWTAFFVNTTGVLTSGQQLPAVALPGFIVTHQIKATTAIGSLANNDFVLHWYRLEGFRIAHLGWGSAGALPIVVSFRFYSTAAGVAFIKIANAAVNRLYFHEITVAAGWNFYSFEVPGDTTGTWDQSNGVGLSFMICPAGKAAVPLTTLDAWGTSNQNQTTNSTNLLGTNNNLTQVTGLFIAQSNGHLPTINDLPRLIRSYDEELRLCQRYWETGNSVIIGASTGVGNSIVTSAQFAAAKRVLPTMATSYTNLVNTTSAVATGLSVYSFQWQTICGAGAAGANTGALGAWTADARF